MRNTLARKVLLGFVVSVCYCSTFAQSKLVSSNNQTQMEEAAKRLENFKELKSMGYTEKEIYEDLGNAHFLSKNYETALFWYDKLVQLSDDGLLDRSYQKRYDYAVSQLGKKSTKQEESDENWTELVKADYYMADATSKTAGRSSFRNRFKPLNFNTGQDATPVASLEAYRAEGGLSSSEEDMDYETPIVLTKDGNTAFFSKVAYQKPVTGIFSKKEMVHKIYKADKVNGEWKTIKELPLCPKEFSALHPAISADGKRLFFASNMPGTFGAYDIYVSSIGNNTVGVAKNLGEKVNTKKNDMYPKVVDGNTLVFASEGHKGYGGLDVFMVEVERKKVGLAINLGSPINSGDDDFSVQFGTEKEMGYVVSNRGTKNTAQKVAFSYIGKRNNTNDRDYRLLEAMNSSQHTDYSSSVFEDE